MINYNEYTHGKDLNILHDWVLLMPMVQTHSHGIEIPASSRKIQVPILCRVSAVGEKVVDKEHIKEGAMVIVKKQTGKLVEFEGYEYKLVQETDILAVVEPEDGDGIA